MSIPTRPYFPATACNDLAFEALKAANVHISDEDVESLSESIKKAVDDWFGDMKHLTPSYRPRW